jgi:hypothetical protein
MENQGLFMKFYTQLEATAKNTFSQHGWPHNLQIGPPQ